MRPALFSELMARIGASDDTLVIAYSDAESEEGARDTRYMFATRLWWTLRHYGHDQAAVLNGGWRRWVSEGRPVSRDDVMPEGGEFTARGDGRLLCRIDELLARYEDPAVQVVNVLPRPVYVGAANPAGNARVGHIPGSVNLDPDAFLDEQENFKSADELQTVLDEAGISRDREVIVHCQAGIRSTVALFVLALLGWERARLYDGSMWEWANRDDTPLVIGESPT